MFPLITFILVSFIDFMLNNILGIAGGIGAVFMALVVWLTRKYLVPFLVVEKRRRYARYISCIADEITDDLVRKYPDKEWVVYFDEAVDKVIEVCGIDTEVAGRAVSAALSRK
ncbi:MAG: hypothetical protein CVT49_08390 [candidate division Zixibacteria bacterium HGW-Zixibacteria-1]|nr:MAG: hypothetical protein CVT49_08390 [candidate division Zixibacteria bacterium HGW-Zixibacteria-1]